MVENTSPGVLIIDDQPDLRALLQTILRHHGFSVFLAQNGPDGALMFRISREKISLVLIDADLPDWSHLDRARAPEFSAAVARAWLRTR